MTFTTFSDGNVLYDHELNGNFMPVKITSGGVYTGTDFNSTNDGSASADVTANHTIQISAADLDNATYLYVYNTFYAQADSAGAGDSGSVTLQIERNETGASSWSDVMAVTTLSDCDATVTIIGGRMTTLIHIITLTAGEKTNGIDVKFTSHSLSAVSAGAGTKSFTNRQTWFNTGY